MFCLTHRQFITVKLLTTKTIKKTITVFSDDYLGKIRLSMYT